MLAEAERKKALHPSQCANVAFIQGMRSPCLFPAASFDAVTIAFGFRNMADRARCLAEIRRVLRPGGRLFILEFSQPWPWVRPLYSFHLRHIVPAVAGILTGDRAAYEYLGSSIGAFPDRDALSAEIKSAGFIGVSAMPMTMGVVALHAAQLAPQVS